jgi:hypothetical protein
MIGIEILGRLGNQMFQYAFAHSLSRKLGVEYFLLETNKFNAYKYFNIDFNPQDNKYRSLKFRLRHLFSARVIMEDQTQETETFIQKAVEDEAIYKGFYQSLAFFNEDLQNIRSIFTVRAEYRTNIKEKMLSSGKPLLVIHIRLTDYKTFGNRNMVVPFSYYNNCFKALGDLSQYETWVISDDISGARKVFSSYSYFNFSDGADIMHDFQMMQQADFLIIANSSFSWWGAYLNENAKIYAPKYWLGFHERKEHPAGISKYLSWQWIEA